jgi:hypothetical protein
LAKLTKLSKGIRAICFSDLRGLRASFQGLFWAFSKRRYCSVLRCFLNIFSAQFNTNSLSIFSTGLKNFLRLWRWTKVSSTINSITGPFGQAFHSSSKRR